MSFSPASLRACRKRKRKSSPFQQKSPVFPIRDDSVIVGGRAFMWFSWGGFRHGRVIIDGFLKHSTTVTTATRQKHCTRAPRIRTLTRRSASFRYPKKLLRYIFIVASSLARSSNTAGGTKRKRMGEPKFYAVQSGHTPGVYTNWKDCLDQIRGFKGAKCKPLPPHCLCAPSGGLLMGLVVKSRVSRPPKMRRCLCLVKTRH